MSRSKEPRTSFVDVGNGNKVLDLSSTISKTLSSSIRKPRSYFDEYLKGNRGTDDFVEVNTYLIMSV